jgi:uncharacterized lipoprotein YmbA
MRHTHLLFIAAAACVAAACASTPEPKYFVLQAPSAQAGAAGTRIRPVFLEAVSIPPQLDRPQIVLTRAGGEVAIDDGHRWAAPLQADITQVLARALAALGPAPVAIDTASIPPDADRISVRILALDSRLGEEASIDATWEVRQGDRSQAGTTHVREPAPGGYDALVQAHSSALARLATDIRTSIVALHEGDSMRDATACAATPPKTATLSP